MGCVGLRGAKEPDVQAGKLQGSLWLRRHSDVRLRLSGGIPSERGLPAYFSFALPSIATYRTGRDPVLGGAPLAGWAGELALPRDLLVTEPIRVTLAALTAAI